MSTSDPNVYISGGTLSTTPSYSTVPTQLTAFGELRTAQNRVIFASKEEYSDLQPTLWQVGTSGAGNTVTYDSTNHAANLHIESTGYVVRQSPYIPYIPMRSVKIQLTCIPGAQVGAEHARWGFFDAINGVGFGENNGGFYTFVRFNGTDSKRYANNWEGPDTYTYDGTKMILFQITFGWQGAGDVAFSTLVDGVWKTFDVRHTSNNLTRPYMQTAVLPMRAEISVGVTPSTRNFKMICWGVGTEGGPEELPSQGLVVYRPQSSAIPLDTTTPKPVITIRRKISDYQRRRVNVTHIDVKVNGTSPSAQFLLYYFPAGTANPLTGSSFVSANTYSAVEYDVTASAISLTGGYLIGFTSGGGTGGNSRIGFSDDVQLFYPFNVDGWGAGDPTSTNTGANPAYISICAIGTGSGGAPTADGAIQFSEF